MPDSLVPGDAGIKSIPVDAVTAERWPRYRDALRPEAAAWLQATGFSARAGETALVPDPGGGIARVLVGLGSGRETPPLLAGKLPGVLPVGDYHLREGFPDRALSALAWGLGAYAFARYRKTTPKPRLVLPDDIDARAVTATADAVYFVRDLINTAPNDLGPAELAETAKDLAARYGASFEVTAGDALKAGGFNLIDAVGAAASPDRAPRLIDMTWGNAGDPAVTIVGKGVCFDTGGVDIKTAAGMLLMKKDMAGAANALGLARMIMDADLRLRLRVLIPAVENAVGGSAFRPGDVFAARNGTRVEIGNTDAEGRLVLADAICLAVEDRPQLLIDLATLTGAARTAVGPDIVPFYATDDALAQRFAEAGEAVADPVWRMPLWRPYASYLDSTVADINNAGQSPFAGSIVAALFLARFVPAEIPWLHADIYGWNPKTLPGKPEGGEAQAIRALFALLKDRYPA